MRVLRRVLYWHAAVWIACGVAIAVAPRWVLESLFDQPPAPDVTYVRVCGAMSVGLALTMILVAQKLDLVWWWAWTFALTDVAILVLTGSHAVLGVPPGASGALWWLFAATTLLLGAGVLIGLARAGQEKPFV